MARQGSFGSSAVWDEMGVMSVEDLKKAVAALKEAGVRPPYGAIVHPMAYGGTPACEEMDKRRGVACALIRGHKGDHHSLSGIPFENPPDYSHLPKPSPEDIEAAATILREAGLEKDPDA